MQSYQFDRAARKNRRKAVFFTLVFHLVLVGGLAYSGNVDVESYLPDNVKEWLGWQNGDPNADTTDETVIRP